MPKYMIQFTYSQTSRAGLVEKPQDRRIALRKLFDQAGGQLEAFYFCFGRWDGAVIADFASQVDVTAALIAIGRTAAFDEVDTTVLIEHEDAVRAMEIANEISNAYVAPAAA